MREALDSHQRQEITTAAFAWCLSLLAGCAPPSTDGIKDDGGSANEQKWDGGLWMEPEQADQLGDCELSLVPPCGEIVIQKQPFWQIETLGEGFRIADAVDGVLVLEREVSGGTEIVAFNDSFLRYPFKNDRHLGVLSDARPGRHVVDIQYGENSLSPMPMLECSGPPWEDCRVVLLERGKIGEPIIVQAVADGGFPPLSRPNGLAAETSEEVLLFGNGIWRGDARRWERLMFFDDETEILAVSRNHLWNIQAVGTNGRWWELTDELPRQSGTEADLIAVNGRVAGSAAGELVRLDLERPTYVKQIVDEPIAFVSSGWAVSRSGCVFRYDDKEETACLDSVVPGEPVALTRWQCADTTNMVIATRDALYNAANHFNCMFIH